MFDVGQVEVCREELGRRCESVPDWAAHMSVHPGCGESAGLPDVTDIRSVWANRWHWRGHCHRWSGQWWWSLYVPWRNLALRKNINEGETQIILDTSFCRGIFIMCEGGLLVYSELGGDTSVGLSEASYILISWNPIYFFSN